MLTKRPSIKPSRKAAKHKCSSVKKQSFTLGSYATVHTDCFTLEGEILCVDDGIVLLKIGSEKALIPLHQIEVMLCREKKKKESE